MKLKFRTCCCETLEKRPIKHIIYVMLVFQNKSVETVVLHYTFWTGFIQQKQKLIQQRHCSMKQNHHCVKSNLKLPKTLLFRRSQLNSLKRTHYSLKGPSSRHTSGGGAHGDIHFGLLPAQANIMNKRHILSWPDLTFSGWRLTSPKVWLKRCTVRMWGVWWRLHLLTDDCHAHWRWRSGRSRTRRPGFIAPSLWQASPRSAAVWRSNMEHNIFKCVVCKSLLSVRRTQR